MINKFEGGYEDSYQKRDRLRNELQAASEDWNRFIDVSKKDASASTDYLEKIEEEMAKIEELQNQDKILWEKIGQKNKELSEFNKTETDIDKKIEAGVIIQEEIISLHEQESGVSEAIDALENVIDAMTREQSGMLGDLEGGVAVVEAKYKKIIELRRQLNELDGNPAF